MAQCVIEMRSSNSSPACTITRVPKAAGPQHHSAPSYLSPLLTICGTTTMYIVP
jgi:hypothetical protein